LAAVVLVAAAATIAACYPSPDMSIEEFDTVVTVVDENVEFQGLQYWIMPDTVLQRPNDGAASRAHDDLILGDIQRNMEQLGYSRVFEPDSAELVLLASVITEEKWAAHLRWNWGGWWGGSAGLSYPPVGFTYLYTLGTVSIDMAFIEDVDLDATEIPVVWSAAISGPLQSDEANTANRITNGIDQAYAQSPYLKPE